MTPRRVLSHFKLKGIVISKEDAEKVSAGISRFESNNLEDGWTYEMSVQSLNKERKIYTVIPSTILKYSL